MLKAAIFPLVAFAALTAPFAEAGTLGVYQSDRSGFDTRTYWYDDGREITVFDTQFLPSMTEAMIADIRLKSANPITRVVVTHPNPDKFNGLSVLHHLGAVSIASEATADALPEVDAYKRYYWVHVAKAFTEATYPTVEPIQQTFSGTHVIKLQSGETISLFELGHPGVSSTQTVARIDATGDLIVGDLVNHHAHAWLEGGIVNGKPTPSIQGWINDLDQLATLGDGVVHGGRGDDAPVNDAVREQKAYLQAMDQLVTSYVRDLGTSHGELDDPTTAAAHYARIQERAVEQFPQRRLAYLVGYGVYGLVNSKKELSALTAE